MKQEDNHTKSDDRSLDKWRGLIERYFDARTTDEEEQKLRRFLMTEQAAAEEFDEIKAVMGFLVTGKNLRETTKKRTLLRYTLRWAAAVFITCMATTAAWQIADRHQNVCVAYIYGEKCTDTREVMSQLKLSLSRMQYAEEDMTVEEQLNDIFQTLDEDITTISK